MNTGNSMLSATEEKERQQRAAYHSVWVSVVINFFLSLGQVVIGFLSLSYALIADGIHSLSDLLADFIVLVAGKKGAEAADFGHPYGHHRYENMASLALGAILLLVGMGMLYTAFKKIESPETIPSVHSIALYMAVITLFLKEGLFRYMLRVAKDVKSSMLLANAWHARSDAASSLVVGIGIIGNLMGYTFLDPVAALVVGLMVFRMGWTFSKAAFDDLTDASIDKKSLKDIEAAILSTEGVEGLHDLRSRKTGDWILLDVHIEVCDDLSVVEGHNIAKEVRQYLLTSFSIMDANVHVDPVSCTCHFKTE